MKRKPLAEHSISINRDARVLEAFACETPVELVHGCAHDVLAAFPFQGSELVYSDPPICTRPAGRGDATASTKPRPTMSRCSTS